MTDEALRELLKTSDCLFDRNEVEARLDAMADQLTNCLADQEPLLLCVMTGGVVVTAALMMRLQFPLQLDYVHATRYRGELSGRDLQWLQYPQTSVRDRVVLIVDDILDEGDTLAGIRDWCEREGAAAVHTAVLVDKQHDRRCPELKRADFTGLEAPDRYLFGYGMDCREYWRNAPGIYALPKS